MLEKAESRSPAASLRIIYKLTAKLKAVTAVFFIALAENRTNNTVSKLALIVGTQTESVMDMRGGNVSANGAVGHAIDSFIKCESIAFHTHCKADLFAFRHIHYRIFFFFNFDVFAYTLHGVNVCVFNNTGIVDCLFNEEFGIFENLGISIAVLALKCDSKVQSAAAFNAVTVEIAVQNVDRE